MENENFIRVGTTLYKIVNQPRINGGFVKKRIVWNNETLRQDYGKDFIATVPKYDGFCTVPNHVNYQPVVDKFLHGLEIEQLQVIHAQLVLFPEDLPYQGFDV